MKEIINLLDQVKAINKGYAIAEQNSQDHFNIFKILQVQSDKVRLHSSFLAELLNPKGSHRKGAGFLEYFVESILPEKYKGFNCRNTRVVVEKFIGPINKDCTQGGRIDILIENDQGHSILIENKIYAGDQPKQLIRYANYMNGKEGVILYLTLKGEDASKDSKGDLKLGDDYYITSYKWDIVKWLEKCYQLSADSPILRETIRQYINLIKLYTGQTKNKQMFKDIKDTLLQNSQNLTSGYHIASNFEKVKNELLKSFWLEVSEKLQILLGEEYKVHLKDTMEKNYPALFINKKDLFDKWKIQFVLEPLNGRSSWMNNYLYYGIWYNNRKLEQKEQEKLQKLFGRKTKNPKWWLELYNIHDVDFSSIKTLNRILPGTSERVEVQELIISTYRAYILENRELMNQMIEIIEPKTDQVKFKANETM